MTQSLCNHSTRRRRPYCPHCGEASLAYLNDDNDPPVATTPDRHRARVLAIAGVVIGAAAVVVLATTGRLGSDVPAAPRPTPAPPESAAEGATPTDVTPEPTTSAEPTSDAELTSDTPDPAEALKVGDLSSPETVPNLRTVFGDTGTVILIDQDRITAVELATSRILFGPDLDPNNVLSGGAGAGFVATPFGVVFVADDELRLGAWQDDPTGPGTSQVLASIEGAVIEPGSNMIWREWGTYLVADAHGDELIVVSKPDGLFVTPPEAPQETRNLTSQSSLGDWPILPPWTPAGSAPIRTTPSGTETYTRANGWVPIRANLVLLQGEYWIEERCASLSVCALMMRGASRWVVPLPDDLRPGDFSPDGNHLIVHGVGSGHIGGIGVVDTSGAIPVTLSSIAGTGRWLTDELLAIADSQVFTLAEPPRVVLTSSAPIVGFFDDSIRPIDEFDGVLFPTDANDSD